MDMLRPFDSQTQLLSKVLDLRSEKAQVIAANIANAETPGYSPARFEFEKELAAAIDQGSALRMATSHAGHISLGAGSFHAVSGKIVIEPAQTAIGDGNGVSVDQEMLDLSENALLYETATALYKKKTTMLKHVISGGQ
jgi:flagellar basal-body rod protein FlgB